MASEPCWWAGTLLCACAGLRRCSHSGFLQRDHGLHSLRVACRLPFVHPGLIHGESYFHGQSVAIPQSPLGCDQPSGFQECRASFLGYFPLPKRPVQPSASYLLLVPLSFASFLIF